MSRIAASEVSLFSQLTAPSHLTPISDACRYLQMSLVPSTRPQQLEVLNGPMQLTQATEAAQPKLDERPIWPRALLSASRDHLKGL